MKQSKSQIIASILLLVLALGLLGTGVWGFIQRGTTQTAAAMLRMRNFAVLRTASGAIVQEIALDAKREARAYADANKFSRNQRAAYADEQEKIAREAAEKKYFQFDGLDRSDLNLAITNLELALSDYEQLEKQEKEAYALTWREQQEQLAAQNVGDEQLSAEGEALSEDALMSSTAEKVDYSGFVPSAQLAALSESLTPSYDAMYDVLALTLPDLKPTMREDLRDGLIQVVKGGENSFQVEYDNYAASGAEAGFEGGEKTRMLIARQATNLVVLAVGALIAALAVFYYKPLKRCCTTSTCRACGQRCYGAPACTACRPWPCCRASSRASA